MAVAPENEDDEAPERDSLGWACHVLHITILIYAVAGWVAGARGALVFYLVFLPAVVLHWQLNKNTCVLNNLESLIRSGRWRDPENREEGVWLQTVVRRATGLPLTAAQMDLVSYAGLALLWGLGWGHFFGWQTP